MAGIGEFLHQGRQAVTIAPRCADREAATGKFAHDSAADGIAGTHDQRYPLRHMLFSRLP